MSDKVRRFIGERRDTQPSHLYYINEEEYGMGIFEVLTILFVILKLTGVIAWSWWVVFLPIIISATIYVIVVSIILVNLVLETREQKNREASI